MKHKTEGLARKCNANDLFLVTEGLQCGNCLAVEDTLKAAIERNEKADQLSIETYGKKYNQLPDDGPEQDYIMGMVK